MSEPRPVDRQLLPRTLGPWFGRFHELTEIQKQSIPLIMEGRHVLLCSATASGKTEAYAAPAAEITLTHGAKSAAVIIVSPTRALANDLKRRLEAPMSLVDLSLGRYTGENKELVKGALPTVVITTPEALDSLLARRPQSLAAVRFIVLDEIHVLDGTPRGDQLRILLHRLDLAAKHPPQRIAASATVDHPQALAARYLKDPQVIVVPGARRIIVKAFDGPGVAQVAEHLSQLARHGLRKILVFCRNRNQVETFAAKLPGHTPFENRIYAHHGSIAQNRRERNERLFLQASSGVCFATLTLEMGIDIGSVDYTLLIGLPSDVSSLLQRIGRGGRRRDSNRAGYAPANPAEDLIFKTMFRLAKAGQLCGSPYGFRPSILAQQALALACSNAYIEAKDLRAIIPKDLRQELGPSAAELTLDVLVENEHLERSGATRYVATESSEARYLRGTLHSNIEDVANFSIIDRLTGDVIGTVVRSEGARIEIGGESRKVVKESDDRILTDSAGAAEAARFKPTGSPSTSLPLARAVIEACGVPPNKIALLPYAGTQILLHGLGSIGALFLIDLLMRKCQIPKPDSISAYTQMLPKPIEKLPEADIKDSERFLVSHFAKLEKLSAPGPWVKSTPDHLRKAATRRSCGLDAIVAYLNKTEFINLPEPGPDLSAILRHL